MGDAAVPEDRGRSPRDLGDAFMTAARQIRRLQVAALEPFGLNPSQSRALRVLSRTDEPMRPGDLAARLRIVARSATDVVDSLETAGFVRRDPDPKDRRAVLLSLTDAGRELSAAINDAQHRVSAGFFSHLAAEERETLRGLLERLGEAAAAGDGT